VGLGDRVGALKPGMAADIVILDLNEPAFVPFNSAARQIVYAEAGRAVETVFVNGRPVVRGGKLVTVDEEKLAREAAELATAFRRDASDLAARIADLTAPLLDANRAAWKVPLGLDRYVGRPKSDGGSSSASVRKIFWRPVGTIIALERAQTGRD
jgi:5-methylthioadenosine/S-adenosylhomocysteine deaminase